MNWYDNELCEICKAHWEPEKVHGWTCDVAWLPSPLQHCIDLRRNREARKHKNTHPKQTVF